MGRIIIQEETVKNPISLIGKEAGVCWGANIEDPKKNYKRGLSCIASGHGRTMEFPDVYMIIDGYSARVIRELYTHIGGSPTRLQASTRYIDYEHGFSYVTPPSIANDFKKQSIYEMTMDLIALALRNLEDLGTPREDSALLLPLGMTTKIVLKINSRTLTDMSRQRMCSRAYHEFRNLFNDIIEALSSYSTEWKEFCQLNFMPKCEYLGWCPEEKSCGRYGPKPEK